MTSCKCMYFEPDHRLPRKYGLGAAEHRKRPRSVKLLGVRRQMNMRPGSCRGLRDLPFAIQDQITVDQQTKCWHWTGYKRAGYGRIQQYGKKWQVHRLVWILIRGEILDDLELDHVKERCRSKDCCNPDHLEPVTHKVNVQRGAPRPADTCGKGHDKRGQKRCRDCMRGYWRKYDAKRRPRVRT